MKMKELGTRKELEVFKFIEEKVYENDCPVRAKELEEKFGGYVYAILPDLINNGFIVKSPDGGYDLHTQFKTVLYDQLRFFEKLREEKEGITYEYNNNHALYGFDKNLSPYQEMILSHSIKQIDDIFDNLNGLKALTELNGKGKELISAKLLLSILSYEMGKMIKDMIPKDFSYDESEKYIRFFKDLCRQISVLAGEYEIPIYLDYPSVICEMVEKYLSNEYDKIENISEMKFEKKKAIYEKFMKIDNRITLLSTPSMFDIPEHIGNTKFAIDMLVKHYQLKGGRDRYALLHNMERIYSYLSRYGCIGTDGLKGIQKKVLKTSEIIEKYLTKEELNFLLDFIGRYKNTLSCLDSQRAVEGYLLHEIYSEKSIWKLDKRLKNHIERIVHKIKDKKPAFREVKKIVQNDSYISDFIQNHCPELSKENLSIYAYFLMNKDEYEKRMKEEKEITEGKRKRKIMIGGEPGGIKTKELTEEEEIDYGLDWIVYDLF